MDRMVSRSNKIVRPVYIGDNVFVPIPNLDKDVEIQGIWSAAYTLGTMYGVLEFKYCRSIFTVTTYQGLTKENVNQQDTVSVRVPDKSQSIGDGQEFLKCSCKICCKTKSCKCQKASILCNSRCHNSLACINK
jgi:hypothetical protein